MNARFARTEFGKVKLFGAAGFYAKNERMLELSTTESVLNALSQGSLFGGLRYIHEALSETKLYKIYPNTLRIPELPSSEDVMSDHGENSASIFKRISSKDNRRTKKAKSEIISSLKLAVPELETIIVKNVAGYVVPLFQVQNSSDASAHQFNASQLSDGTLRLFGILLALYQPNAPSIMAIEEPEQNINPGILPIVCEAIAEVSRTSQIFVATHSPRMMDEFETKYFVAFEKRDGSTVAGPIEKEQRMIVERGLMSLGELSLSDVIRVDG